MRARDWVVGWLLLFALHLVGAVISRLVMPAPWWPREWGYSLFVWPISMATCWVVLLAVIGRMRKSGTGEK